MRAKWKLRFSDFLRVGCFSLRNYMLVYSRRSVISSSFLGKKVRVYCGNTFKTLTVKPLHLKHSFWEFNFTKCMRKSHTLAKKKLELKLN